MTQSISHVQIPGYTLIEIIGEGGMATVWKARQEKLDRIVAVKLLRHRMQAGEDDYNRFLYEARAAASLIHPNIVQVIDAGEQGGHAYYVMEYVPGPTVGDLLAKGEVYSEADALGIALEVAEGLDYGWRDHRVVHCDIKPDNLLMHRNGRTKVADLGLAKVLGKEGVAIEEGMTLGTPNYFSPEQALVEDDLDHRTDMYALGTTLYHMVTGQLPFGNLPPDEVAEKQVHGQLADPLDINPKLSLGLCALIERLLAKNPRDRYAEWSDVMEDIHAVRAGNMIAKPLAKGVPCTIRRSSRRDPNAPPRRAAPRAAGQRSPVAVLSNGQNSSGIPIQRRGASVQAGAAAGAYQCMNRQIPTHNVWPIVIILAVLVIGLYAYTAIRASGS